MPTAPSTLPGMSKCRRRRSVWHESRDTSAAPTVTTASGMLRMKMSRHDAAATSAPPTAGPAAVAMPVQAVHRPIARPASSRYVARRSARLPGVSSAPTHPGARARRSASLRSAQTRRARMRRRNRIRLRRTYSRSRSGRRAPLPAGRARRHQRVAEEDPLLACEPEVELPVDRRQRDVDDEGVEERHRRAEDRRTSTRRLRVP